MAITVDTKLKQIIKDPEAKAILLKYFPVDLDDPMVRMAYGMTLRKCCSFPQVEISDEQFATLEKELLELGH